MKEKIPRFPFSPNDMYYMKNVWHDLSLGRKTRRKSRYLCVALNICDRTALSNMHIRKTPSSHGCLRASRYTWTQAYENRLIPYNRGRIIINLPGDTRHLVRQERERGCVETMLRKMMYARLVVLARYTSGDPHSYGAIEFSSPRRRALNIHTVGRNRVPGVPFAHVLSPSPTHPPRALCALPCIDHRLDSGCSLLPAPAEFKPRVHDRSRLHRSKSNILQGEKSCIVSMTYCL